MVVWVAWVGVFLVVGFGSADGWVLGASFTVGAAPVWAEFLGLRFPWLFRWWLKVPVRMTD